MNPLDRYVFSEIAVPAAAAVTLLLLVFVAFSASEILADALAGRVGGSVVAKLVGLRMLIGADVILPTGVFLAALWAFARLDRDHELTVLAAAGVSPMRTLLGAAVAALLVAALVALLAVQARPWAYATFYRLEAQAVVLDVAGMQAGRFYPLDAGAQIHADRIDAAGAALLGVFGGRRDGDDLRLVRARDARVEPGVMAGERLLVLGPGTAYALSGQSLDDRIYAFRGMRHRVREPQPDLESARRRRARPTAELFNATDPREVAERQWRIALGPLALLTVLLGARIGQGRPRTSIWPRLAVGVIAYVAVFNLAAMARTWVENGMVGAVPGLYWVLAVPAALLALTHWRAGLVR